MAPDSELLDRDGEIAAIEAALGEAARSTGTTALISAGVGMGKTALVTTAVDRGRAAGFTVLAARGVYLEREVPFGLVSRLFEPALRLLDNAELNALFDCVPAAAARMTAAIRDEDTSVAGGSGMPTALNALHHLLARITASAPVLLAVDDLQWVDAPSLGWLATVPARVEHMPALLVASVCDGERCTEPALMAELRASSPSDLRLAGLSARAVSHLVGRTLGATPTPGVVTACTDATGGNPMLLTALSQALADDKVSVTAGAIDQMDGTVAANLAATVTVRLRRVSPYATSIAQAVAVLHPNADLDHVAELTSIDTATVAEVVAVLTRMGLLRPEGRALTFAYPLLRMVVMNDLTHTAMQAVHGQAARLLQASGAPEECVAAHLLSTRPLDESWVPDVLRLAAGKSLAAGAPDDAVAYLRRALDEPLTDDARVPLLMELGVAEAHVDVRAATRHLAEVVEHGPITEQRTDAVVPLANLLAVAGRDEEAIPLLEGVAGQVDDRDLRVIELRLCRVSTAGAAMDQLGPVEAPQLGDATDERRLLSLLAERETFRADSRPVATELAQRALAVPLTDPDDVGPSLKATLVLANAGSLHTARNHCDAIVAAAAQWQHRPYLAASHSVRSAILRQLGHLQAAHDDAIAAVDLLVSCGVDRRASLTLECLARLVQVLVELGEHETAAELLQRAGVTGDLPGSRAGAMLMLARGRLAAAAGRPAAGMADLLAGGSRLSTMKIDNPAIAPWRSEAALCLWPDQRAKARRYAAEAVEAARGWGAPGPLGVALSAQATVVGGPWGLATHEEAVSVLKPSPARLDLARCLVAYGSALNLAGRRTAARQALRAALDVAEECGSPMVVRQARVELQASGARRCWTPATGLASLTACERRAIHLAADGKTNKEIAATLFIHLRTVENHLTHAYRKLGITGRDQLAAVLDPGHDPDTLAAG